MDDSASTEGQRSDETDSAASANTGPFLLQLRPKQASEGDDMYVFAAETEEEFNNWGKLLSLDSKPLDKKSDDSSSPKNTVAEPKASISPEVVAPPSQSNTEPSPTEHLQPSAKDSPCDDSSPSENTPVSKDFARSVSTPLAPYTKEKAENDFHEILKRADMTFWEVEEEEEEEPKKVNLPSRRSLDAATIESCLLAPSTKKSPNSSPTHSPPTPRRADLRWSSLPAQTRIASPTKLGSKTKKSPTGSPTSRKKVSKRLGASWERNSWGGDGSPKTSPMLHRKSWAPGSLSQADFKDSYGISETRSSHRLEPVTEPAEVNSQKNPVVGIPLKNGESAVEKENSRPRSATLSLSTSPEQSTGLKAPQFNRTLSFITRMKEGNKKRKMRQIPISADNIVKPAKTGFVKLSNKGKTASIKSNRCYAVLKDDWLYLYKKPADTCTLDAYDMTSYVVSANVGSVGIRNFRNQKLSILLEHKVTGDVTILTSEVAIEIFEWAEKLQKASKEQGLAIEGLNLEQGRSTGKPFISAPIMPNVESSLQSQSRDDQLAELHRHRLIQEAMKENQQLIMGTQRVKEAPEQFPLGPSDSPSLQRKKEKLETKFNKASEEEEQQAMRDLTILKKRRISAQVKQDTILRQLEGKKHKRNQQKEEEYALMRKQLDELNGKLSKINSEIEAKSHHKEQKLKAIKERKALEMQVLEQQNQLLRYRRATQEALENIMEKAPVQRQSLTTSTDDSSDEGERHTNSDGESNQYERSASYQYDRSDSRLSTDSTPGISLQRPSIDVGIPGPTFVLQRASVELQIAPSLSQDAPVQSLIVPVQTQNAPVESKNTFPNDSKKRGSGQAQTKRRMLPVIPGSPDSSRSSGSHSTNSQSGTESENELQIVEPADSMLRDNSNSAFRKYRKSEGSPTTGIQCEWLSLPGTEHSPPTSSDSGSDSPDQGHKNIHRPLGRGRSLPDIPSAHKRQSKDSTSIMDIVTDELPKTSKNTELTGSQNGSEQERVSTMPSRQSSDSVTKSDHHSQNSRVDTNGAVKHDANDNNLTSVSIYLRPPNPRGTTRTRPVSEGSDTKRLQVPNGGKKKQRSASDSQGLRTEISPDVLRDIEEFEMMARKALWEAGWQIPI